ncbi:ribosome maturation factor RimP [uncultured Deinococcus sp.]|nr:ribosome maturation factor RimP [uncultured Deinococcus sp.]
MNNNPAHNGQDTTQPTPADTGDSRLHALAQQAVAPMGLEVLEVQRQTAGRELIVLVRIDRLDEQPVTMEDLTKASRAAEAEFDRVDPIEGEYRLEFESPGGKRPLLRGRHFERMLGLRARVRGEGHSFTAPIRAVDGDQVTFEVNGELVTVTAGRVQANLAEFPDRHR